MSQKRDNTAILGAMTFFSRLILELANLVRLDPRPTHSFGVGVIPTLFKSVVKLVKRLETFVCACRALCLREVHNKFDDNIRDMTEIMKSVLF